MSPPKKEADLTTYKGKVAKHFRMLREKAKITPEELSHEMSVSLATVYNWEAGNTFPKVEQLPLLGGIYKVNASKILPPFPE